MNVQHSTHVQHRTQNTPGAVDAVAMLRAKYEAPHMQWWWQYHTTHMGRPKAGCAPKPQPPPPSFPPPPSEPPPYHKKNPDGTPNRKQPVMTQEEYRRKLEERRERKKKNMIAYLERQKIVPPPPPPSCREDVPGEWIDDDGIVLPQWRAEVARRRATRRARLGVELADVGFAMHVACSRKDD